MMFLTNWTTYYRSVNEYDLFEDDDKKLCEYEEENYMTPDKLSTLKEEKLYEVKYNNSHSLYEKIMLLSFLWKHRFRYQILMNRDYFKWYNRYFLGYLGFIPKDKVSHATPFQPLPNYLRNITRKTTLIVHLYEDTDGDRCSYFYLAKNLKCPLLVLGFDYNLRRVVVDGCMNEYNGKKSFNNVKNLVQKRLSYYPSLGKNVQLMMLTDNFANGEKHNDSLKPTNLEKIKMRFGKKFFVLLVLSPLLYLSTDTCWFHYFHKLVLSKQHFLISYVEHTIYFFKHCWL